MTPLTTKAAEIRARLKTAIELGDRTGVRGKRPENIYNAADDALALIEQQAAELAEARAHEASLINRRDYYRERMQAAGGELNRISAAIGSVRFMDPPDGGDVPLAEQVRRMREALTTAESERDELLREKERLGAALGNARLAIVLSLIFLSRDLGTDRLRGTVSDVIRKLSDADTEIRRARSALENGPAGLADATNNPPSDPGTEQREAGL